jgi:hypothetical protein
MKCSTCILIVDREREDVSFIFARWEDGAFFKVTDKWTTLPTKEEITKVVAEHDMVVVGLPLKACQPLSRKAFQENAHVAIEPDEFDNKIWMAAISKVTDQQDG